MPGFEIRAILEKEKNMVSNQMIMETLQKIRDISGEDLCVYALDGTRITTDDISRDEETKSALKMMNDRDDVQEIENRYYFKVFDGNRLEYVVSCEKSEQALMVGKMTVLQLEALIIVYQERYDKDSFIKNLLLDNLLLVDIYNRAKKLHIDPHARRVAYLIETKNREDAAALELVRTISAENENDFVASIDENNIILVKELKDSDGEKEMFHFAYVLADMLNTEAMIPVHVAYGNVADEIRKVSNSYKEAKLALSVGKIFNSEQNVVSYSSLGIGRLIYQLPIPMCKMFIEEIFKGQSPEDFDDETLSTINQFFANSLNVSETSRQLYIHRNTLVYRLDKLQKNTGLDLRVFDDAITFKIALMVVKYMHYMENQE